MAQALERSVVPQRGENRQDARVEEAVRLLARAYCTHERRHEPHVDGGPRARVRVETTEVARRIETRERPLARGHLELPRFDRAAESVAVVDADGRSDRAHRSHGAEVERLETSEAHAGTLSRTSAGGGAGAAGRATEGRAIRGMRMRANESQTTGATESAAATRPVVPRRSLPVARP